MKSGFLSALHPAIFLGQSEPSVERSMGKPMVISTWRFGLDANREAMKTLMNGGSAVDAVEAGIRVPEEDPNVSSVGYGGTPDQEGNVTLDACIMDSDGNAGSVVFLQDVKHPISVARKIMEMTDHVMLAGEGAKRFALANGFRKENLLTESSREKWLKWRERSREGDHGESGKSHDTIGLIALNEEGEMAAGCSTSGLAFKLHGRVGDSPIIGAGMFCDNEVGAAVATGRGEEIMKTLGCFLVVELMRQGRLPQEACLEAVQRIRRRHGDKADFQVAYVALRIDGKWGAAALKDGFQCALYESGSNRVIEVETQL